MFAFIKKLFTRETKQPSDAEIGIKGNSTASSLDTDDRKVVRFGMLTLAFGFGGFLLWASLAPLDEGIPGTGVVTVESKRKTIQHLKGGIVDSIHVREGAAVQAGDVLLRLNDVEINAQIEIVRGQFYLVKAAEARLLAERDGRSTVTFPQPLVMAAESDPRAREAILVQAGLFAARRSMLSSEMSTMDEIITGFNEQIRGLQALEAGKKTQIDLVSKELDSYRGLAEEGFVPRNKLYEQERVLADLSGTRGSDLAQIARAKASINETRLRKLQRQQQFRQEVEKELAEMQKEVGGQSDRLTALKEEFDRTVIKSPTEGVVVGLEAHTVGGVIRPGDRIMEIVPQDEVLIVEAQLPVNLIDKVSAGQLATIHFQIVLAGGAQPAIEGKVVQVSADRLTDQRTGMPYYSARIQITPNGEAELRKHGINVQPGMQADVVIVTGERTLLQYLLKPLRSRIFGGMREL